MAMLGYAVYTVVRNFPMDEEILLILNEYRPTDGVIEGVVSCHSI